MKLLLEGTYLDDCDKYVAYTINCYGVECTVCFGGYENLTMSTNVAEQNRLTQNNVSGDILLNMNQSPAINMQYSPIGPTRHG